ncbi:PH domain-containing protein [Daejeonella sp.]|uniref:PH domain-containing protein n=1 Tax=Daejeonella sp. TaxID=2805397 RepID=UPI003C784932
MQSVKISQSPYQQRKFLADLSLHTAGGTITAPYIPLEAARELQNFALFKIES